jgi:hypothetical protein
LVLLASRPFSLGNDLPTSPNFNTTRLETSEQLHSGGNRKDAFATAYTSYLAPPEFGVGMRVPHHLTSISLSGTRLRILHNHKVTEKRAYILYAARHPIIHAAG